MGHDDAGQSGAADDGAARHEAGQDPAGQDPAGQDPAGQDPAREPGAARDGVPSGDAGSDAAGDAPAGSSLTGDGFIDDSAQGDVAAVAAPELGVSNVLAVLRALPTFAGLDERALSALAEAGQRQSLAAGETLFEAGAAAECGYVLLSGRLELSETRRDGVRRAALEVEPGALVGEIALITATPRPATAVALIPAQVLRIARADFLAVLERDPKAATKLRRAIARRLEQMVKALEGVRGELEKPRPVPRRR
ncbi:Crp/Fnr family transcriptional regulator [Xanthobacter sp. V4C-4]|uniref:Crp/Fnr family transcriptional regulator n=1 Tax=Xanthobacter cornucopiae TaxID=3119924 RepID=UPI00372AC746